MRNVLTAGFSSCAVLSILAMTAAYGQATEQIKLIPESGDSLDFFGFSVAIDDGHVLIGEPGSSLLGDSSGAAYVVDTNDGDTVVQLAVGSPFVGPFGASVALDGELALISDTDRFFGGGGSAYLLDASTGEPKAVLQPAQFSSYFGSAVALDGGLALVGDVEADRRGAAYVFDVPTGQQLAKLVPQVATHRRFGDSLALQDGIALVGSSRDRNDGERAGAAYLFDAVTGEQLAKLTPDVDAIDFFGTSVALNDGLALVTAQGSNRNDVEPAAYIFDVATGAQLSKLSPSGLDASTRFGFSSALEDGIAYIGAPFESEDGANVGGSVYAFDAASGHLLARLTANDAAPGDSFGISVDVDQGLAVVGAYLADGAGDYSGAAYLIDVSGIPEPSSALMGVVALASIGAYRSARGHT